MGVSRAEILFQGSLWDLERLVKVRSNLLAAKFPIDSIGTEIIMKVEILSSRKFIASKSVILRYVEQLVMIRAKIAKDNGRYSVSESPHASTHVKIHLDNGGFLDTLIDEMLTTLGQSNVVDAVLTDFMLVERLAQLALAYKGVALKNVINNKLHNLALSTEVRMNTGFEILFNEDRATLTANSRT